MDETSVERRHRQLNESVYEWDWANRLAKVSSNGITVLENWY